MPRRTPPADPQITREDLLNAVNSVGRRILDPDDPLSLYSSINDKFSGINKRMDAHDAKVDKVIAEVAAFKETYAGDRGKAKGVIAGLSIAGGGLGAAAAKFFKLF